MRVGNSSYYSAQKRAQECVLVFVVICRMCKSVRLLQLFVVTNYKRSVNPIINPNPVSSH
jgi:hypothetical protein